MKITQGNKRIVLLVANYAIKIGKIRLIRLMSRVLLLPFSKKLRIRFLDKYGGTWKKALLNDTFAGLYCNRHEYSYYSEYKDQRVMPTIKLIANGFIIVQIRGVEVSDQIIKTAHPEYRSSLYKKANLDATEQYCIDDNGKVKILDYGDIATTAFLQSI